jgi:HKD family nuclease
MAKVRFISPLDQPTGRRRLLEELRAQLKSSEFSELWIMVAFAKSGPLLRLKKDIAQWRKAGNKIRAVFGIDQLGTTKEALEFAVLNFDEIRVASCDSNGAFSPTFHPKVYLFVGPNQALCYLGSNNLTVGGTETNFEACTIVSLDPSADKETLTELVNWWNEAQSVSLPLLPALVAELQSRGRVITEKEQRTIRKTSAEKGTKGEKRPDPLFPPLLVMPPSAIPKNAIEISPSKTAVIATPDAEASAVLPTTTSVANIAEALAIQVSPHHNGEVFLSKTAIEQNPSFFGWPFTGRTEPKKAGNVGYPQRVPDPIVNIRAFDKTGKLVLIVQGYGLNTVYYDTKSEIRITFRPDILKAMPDYSILVIKEGPANSTQDYDIDVYAPGSPEYAALLTVCNQTMPSGGKPNPRRFGWF